MFRISRNVSLYKQLELQIGVFRKPLGRSFAPKRHASSSGSSKKRGFGFAVPFGVLVTGTMASTVLYAKSDPEFRVWLDQQVPGTSEFIKILCQEDGVSFSEKTNNLLGDIQNWFFNLFSSNEPEHPKIENVTVEKVIPHAVALVDTSHEPKGKVTSSTLKPQRLSDLEKQISDSTAIAVEHYIKAVNAIRDQAQCAKELFSSDLNQQSSNFWSTIKEKSKLRDNLLKTADKNAQTAETKILELEAMLVRGEFDAPTAVLQQTKQNLKRMQGDIDRACEKAEEEMLNTNLTKDLWPKVEAARRHWQEELSILFPNADLNDRQLNILGDEIRQFVLYSLLNVQFYQKEVAKLEMSAEKKLREAIERATTTGDSKDLVAAAVHEEIESERRHLELQYQKKSLHLRAACEEEIRKQLRLQTEIQSDHLKNSIKLREIELERLHRRETNKALTEENTNHQLKVAALVGRLKGIDEGLKAHALIDKSAQQAQDLWTSCQMFYRNIDPHSVHSSIRPLASEVNSIQKTAEDSDEFVKVVIQGIPKEALSRGVFPLNVLKERFLKVERVARTLSAVPEDGTTLPMYFLSWLQGALIWKGVQQITPAELEDLPTAFHILNNYDVLSRARYWVDHGDLMQALRYMNLLSGASKSVAEDWMKEVRIYLECQQAATILLNHASAKGLMYS